MCVNKSVRIIQTSNPSTYFIYLILYEKILENKSFLLCGKVAKQKYVPGASLRATKRPVDLP